MNDLSPTEEDYIKAVFSITERNRGMANTNDIAKFLKTSAASVTDMIKRLSTKGFLNYKKYHGVQLSQAGVAYATGLVRRERLWKVFLHQELGINWEMINPIAEQLKHVQSSVMVAQLDKFLGHPKYDPHGEAIPNAEGRYTLRKQSSLFNLEKNIKASIVAVRNQNQDFLNFLNDHSLGIGVTLEVLKHNDFDHSRLIVIEEKEELLLSAKICQEIYVRSL
jgi:DtxR family Mn-dependent transcriptional regulator